MKLSKEGWAVIEGDRYLSQDIINAGRLDVARDFLLQYKPYIPEGGVVIDVGACLGDFTATFSEFVGEQGWVYAIEPNPEVVECLFYNVHHLKNVHVVPCAFGDRYECAHFVIDQGNIGASYLQRGVGPIEIWPMDTQSFYGNVKFIKMDAEGCEPWILDGAKGLITTYRPVMLLEIDTRALGLQGFKPKDVHERLQRLNYSFEPFEGPHGDILCLPK